MIRTWNVKIGPLALPGALSFPDHPRGLVIFAHGGGSSRFSPQNRQAASYFNSLGFATVLFDLLTETQCHDRRDAFDIGLLSARIVDAIHWAQQDERTFVLPIGLFGAGAGAAAAILATAEQGDVAALVSHGGRPDLACEALEALQAPTPPIVGEHDTEALALNRTAQARMHCQSKLIVIPGASHLFEEEGALEEALEAAGDWFVRFLRAPCPVFDDRVAAGRMLAARLAQLNLERPVVYALPRGGAPVAFEVAAKLNAPLDVVIIRKIGAPGQPELALGAVVDGEMPGVFRNEGIIAAAGVSDAKFAALASVEFREIERRNALYRGRRAPISPAGRTAILVDDGMATGASMELAIRAVRRSHPQKLIVAIPVASLDAAKRARRHVDQLVCLASPESFVAVGQFYRDFHQLSDDEVIDLLSAASGGAGPASVGQAILQRERTGKDAGRRRLD